MKTINLIFTFFSLIFLVSCTHKSGIEGMIQNLGDDTIFVKYNSISNYLNNEIEPQYDTIIVSRGKFSYKVTSTEELIISMIPKKGLLTMNDGYKYRPESNTILLFWKPNELIKVNGSFNYPALDYSIEGSLLTKQYVDVRKQTLTTSAIITQNLFMIDSLRTLDNHEKELDSLFVYRKQVINKELSGQLAFIKGNYFVDMAAYFLCKQPLDTFSVYYNMLDSTVRNGIFKPLLDQTNLNLEKRELKKENEIKIDAGYLVPDFTLNNISGNPFSLYSLKDKYIVLDFWGSWCSWCIKGFPRMNEYYERYSEKVEFIGIACNDTDKDWKEAVAENELKWIHLFNKTDKDKDLTVKFAIRGFPTKIILNKNKEIVQVYVGESEDFYSKLDQLLK